MTEIIYKGLVLKSLNNCRYFSVSEGVADMLIEDKTTSTLKLIYKEGSTTGSLSESLNIKMYGNSREIEPTVNPQKIKNPIVSINGLKLRKMTSDTHTINIVIVNDSESRVIQNYDYTTIVVSCEDVNNEDFVNYLFYSGNLLFLKPIGPKPKCWSFKNFPKITIKDSDLSLVSESDFIYTLRKRYDDYVIRGIDYQDQFILELRNILNPYGIELVRWNKEDTLKTTSYITYMFSQTPTRIKHPGVTDDTDKLISQRLPIEFTLRTPDMVMFFDFKNKFNNVELLTNFCEFKTTDKYGTRWTAAIKWGGITEDFNHIYQQDDNSNFSYQCQFRCELYFYEVIDDRHEFLKDIILKLDSQN